MHALANQPFLLAEPSFTTDVSYLYNVDDDTIGTVAVYGNNGELVASQTRKGAHQRWSIESTFDTLPSDVSISRLKATAVELGPIKLASNSIVMSESELLIELLKGHTIANKTDKVTSCILTCSLKVGWSLSQRGVRSTQIGKVISSGKERVTTFRIVQG